MMAPMGWTLGQDTRRAHLPPKKGVKPLGRLRSPESGPRRLTVSRGVIWPAAPETHRKGTSAGPPCPRRAFSPLTGFRSLFRKASPGQQCDGRRRCFLGDRGRWRGVGGAGCEGATCGFGTLHPHWRFGHKQRRGAAPSCPHSP